MALRDIFLNALGATPEVQKTENSAFKSARDFLINGNRDSIYPTWSDVKMSDKDMYSGYSYAVIQKRGNKVSSLAKNNLKTWAKSEVVDEYQKKQEDVVHPYLKLIQDSTEFTEKQFWKNISIYLDLAGRYYLGVIRSQVKPLGKNDVISSIMTDPTGFVMLNPYEIRRVVDKNKNVAGYIERKKDGRYREWPAYQIIEMRELNPFDPENSQWAMTDAAKNAVYTINQSGDYTRQSLNGNIDAPGIITTDVLLTDEDFANFRARVTQHTKGEPLFGNGTGAIKWDSMQVDLDRAALMDINEINRTELFAVSGTSKTSLGIEQSGTTRETARVQSEQFVSDTAQPRLEDIVDFLNLDYKRSYNREYKQTGYTIEVESAVGKDYDTEQKATALKQSQFQLAMQLIQSGYTTQSAYQFAEGEIDFADLELEKGLDKPKNPEQPEEPEETSPTTPPEGPTSDSGSGNDKYITPDDESGSNGELEDLNGLEPHKDLVENKMEGKESLPFEVEEATCTCEHDHKVETFINEVNEDEGKVVDEAYKEFLKEVREIEKETINATANKLEINAFEESDIIGKVKKRNLTKKLKNAIHKYWWLIFPLFANNSMAKRNEEFERDVQFVFNNDLQAGVDDNAERVAEGHMTTILNDILEASNKAYTNILEDAASELIIKAYKVNPDKFGEYFDHEPTRADALKSIQRTDILEQNRKIYEKANKMAFEGYKREDIVKAIKAEYKSISENRATLIARNETSRAFTRSQFESDKQFLNAIGKLDQAYKVWYSRRPANEQDKICAFCNAMIENSNANPIPFEEPFIKFGESMEVVENGKVKIFTANYENIEGGCLHPNCQCGYKLVFKNAAGEFVKTLNGGAGSGNFGHSGRPGEVGGSGKGGISLNYNELLSTDGPGKQQQVATKLSYQAIQDIENKHPELVNKVKQEKNLKRGYEEYKKWSSSEDRVHDLSYEEYKDKVLSREITSDGRKSEGFAPIYELSLYGAGASPFLEGFLMYAYGANVYHLNREEFDKKYGLSNTIDDNKDLWTDYNEPLYRGVSTNESRLQQLKKGATVSMDGLSSWSSEKDIADRFTKSGLIKGGSIPVVFIDKSKTHDKTMFYPYSSASATSTQYEYVQSGSKKYKITDVHKEGDAYYAEVESY